MRPLSLTVAAFGPYLHAQTVDFQLLGAHGLFLIHGRTGSGKSSILDAMCFALYGETTGGERAGQDMVTTLDKGAETKVVLEFEHVGRHYRVTRYPTQEVAKLRGEGLKNRQTEATLEDLDKGEVLAARARDVTAAVKEMLRCDVDQFRQTIVLPQGDFRRVVTDDGSRREILARIFRTERFAALAERLKEYAKNLAQQGRDIREQRDRLLTDLGAGNVADIVAKLTAAQHEAVAAEARRDAARAVKDKALVEQAAGIGLDADFRALEDLTARAVALAAESDRMLGVARVVERAARAARLADSRDYLDRTTAEHQRVQEELAGAREALTLARATLAAARSGLAELEAAQGAARNSARERYGHLNAQRDNVAGLAAKQLTLAKQNAVLAEAQSRHHAAVEAEGTMVAGIKELEVEAASLASRAIDLDAAREALERAREDLNDLAKVAAHRSEIEALEHNIASADTADARARLEKAVRDNAPGLLAGSLGEGEPCPVCGSVHHPALSSSEDVAALTHAFEEFGQAAATGAGLAARRDHLLALVADVSESRGWQAGAPARSQLEAAERSCAERKSSAAGARSRLDEITAAIAALRTRREEQLKVASDLAAELSYTQGEIKRLEGEIEGVLGSLPAECRDPAEFEERLAESRRKTEELERSFTAAGQAVADASIAEAKAATAEAGLSGRLASDTEKLERTVEEFADKLAKAGFADRVEFEAAELDPRELAALGQELDDYQKQVAAVEAGRVALGGKLHGKERPDLAALENALAQALLRLGEAEDEATEAVRRRDVIKAGHERFLELEGRDAAVAQRRTAAVKLDQLANGQLSGRTKVKLETFVLQSIFHEVLEEGNRHLRHMTGGRYTLLLRETAGASASGLELDVRDNATGSEPRPVATLSGGEGFLASLALALGLSEVAQRRSGGLELGALFIDEGFGSLDAQALDQVVDILRGLQDGHRMVGVISHVEELKRRIPAQLHVIPGRSGSRVEMLLNN